MTADLATYRSAVRRLTAENRRLRAELAAARRDHKIALRAMAAQLQEGLSPELIALRAELVRQRTRADTATSRLNALRRTHDGTR